MSEDEGWDAEPMMMQGDDYGDDGGGRGGGRNIQSMCCALCIGLFLYPGALVFTGWNEQRTVCREEAVQAAEENALTLDCMNNANAADKKGLASGDLGFLNCPLNQSTFKQFSEASFPGLEQVSNLFGASVPAVGMKMTSRMYICKEKCVREECSRRLSEVEENAVEAVKAEGDKVQEAEDVSEVKDEAEEEDAPEAAAADADTKEEEEADRDQMGFRLRRLSGSRRRECTKRCVEWGYWLEWSETLGENNFRDQREALRVCGNPNPTSSGLIKVGASDFHAAAGEVQTEGGSWRLNEWMTQHLPIDLAVSLPVPAQSNFGNLSQLQPPTVLTRLNTVVAMDVNKLRTCTPPGTVGCLEIEFTKSAPSKIVMLGKLSDQDGEFDSSGWTPPENFLCTGQKQEINRMCPYNSMGTGFNLHKGVEQCDETVNSLDELVGVMNAENSMSAWIYRLVGFLGCWIGISMILSPISTMVEMFADSVDSLTECIPGIGCIVDGLTDVLVGVVHAVLCIVGCFCAISSFFFVAAVCWAVMRPLYGILMLIVACCCCFSACACIKMCKDPHRARAHKAKKGGRRQRQEDDEDNE